MEFSGNLMPTFKFKGIDEYLLKLESITLNTDKFIHEAIYEGAKVVADETKTALRSMNVDNSRYKKGQTKSSISSVQRNDLVESFGISPIQNKDGFINVKTGVDGFNRIGQANVRVARMLESGTSYMQKNPVISRASRRARKRCEKAMQESLDKNYKKYFR